MGFSVTTGECLGVCSEGKPVEIDKIATASLKFEGHTVNIDIFKDNDNEKLYWLTTDNSLSNYHIRPKKEIIETYFRDIDDFTAVLLNRETKPIYTATLKTPKERETGFSYDLKSYTWPTLNGGFNPDLSGPYYNYLQLLINLGEFYDEYFTDNMWRSLTHEAIKTLDWTYISTEDGNSEDLSQIDTSHIEPIVRIYGRQFDDLKRYTDAIKAINTITYNQSSNAPDYVLSDILENSGWEAKNLMITTDKDVRTTPLYSGMSFGYTAVDANNEFMRRLKLNSQYLLSSKGTRKGLDAMLALFGFTPEEYSIHEYVYVATGNGNYDHFCESTQGKDFAYPLAKDVITINHHKASFNSYDPYGDLCGIPVAEVGYFPDGPDGDDLSYVIPWYSYGKEYDDGLYFQMNGGWGKREKKKISLEIAPEVTEISSSDDIQIYDETQARMKFAKDFDDLLQEAFANSRLHDVFYVTDISRITEDYTLGNGEDISNASHYFILENEDLYQFLGYSSAETATGYGWRNIKEDEITQPNSAGTIVLYLETIEDNTTGNNPHVDETGYDNGKAYVDSMSNIFGYSLNTNNFIGIDDDTCEQIKKYTFTLTQQEDNRKCWFFSDNYNVKSGRTPTETACDKTSGGTTTFKEADVTSGEQEVVEALEGGSENSVLTIGSGAKSSFNETDGSVYGRSSELSAFNPEDRKTGENGEAAANSIVNVKNLVIKFNITDFKDEMEDYINNSVIPYLIQMIPATAILEWEF